MTLDDFAVGCYTDDPEFAYVLREALRLRKELAEARELLEADFAERAHWGWTHRRDAWLNSHKTEREQDA